MVFNVWAISAPARQSRREGTGRAACAAAEPTSALRDPGAECAPPDTFPFLREVFVAGVQLVPEFDRLDPEDRAQLLLEVRASITGKSASTGDSRSWIAVVVPERLPVEIRNKLQCNREAGFAVPEMLVERQSGVREVVYSPGVVMDRGEQAQEARAHRRWFTRRASKHPAILAEQRPEVPTVYEDAVIRASAVTVPGDCPELRLGLLARRLATRISESDAWRDAILDEHRLQFDPAAEAGQITVHAARIAALRVQIGDVPLGSSGVLDQARSAVLDQARSAVADEHAVLDLILGSLLKRVAALLAYADRVTELSTQLRALRAIEQATGMSTHVNALAAQMGADELAAVKLHRLSADADAVAAKVGAIAAELSRVLAPQPPR